MDKLNEANDLNRKVENAKEFLWLLEKGNSYYVNASGEVVDLKKKNNFRSLLLSANIYTGDDNPRYEEKLVDEQLIDEVVENIIPQIKSYIENLETQLKNLFK